MRNYMHSTPLLFLLLIAKHLRITYIEVLVALSFLTLAGEDRGSSSTILVIHLLLRAFLVTTFCCPQSKLYSSANTRVYPKVSGLSHNEIYAYNNKHSFRSNTKGYGGRTHQNDTQNSDTTAHSGRELYHLQFSLRAAGPETFGYTLVGCS
jgi:hypothetical protein